MADQSPATAISTADSRRAAVYNYLRPLVVGRRVLEIGCGGGAAAALLLRLGARQVVGVGGSQEVDGASRRYREAGLSFSAFASAASAGGFDLALVPEGARLLRAGGPLELSAVLASLLPNGRLACIVENGDAGEGMPYFDVVDALAPHFARVRMFGQTPFQAYGIAEFDETAALALRVESELAGDQPEPSHYIALAGPDEPLSLGYALVQVPLAHGEGKESVAPAKALPAVPPSDALVELRRKLTESEGRAEGLVRASHAQSEEIEELRARLRRTAEARSDLDEEVGRLRRALIEADESVVRLTRKTTEEMTVLAERLTAGLRGEMRPASRADDDALQREKELARCESALSERDDHIASLEIARQEALWRADAADDELARLRAELGRARDEQVSLQGRARVSEEVESRLRSQESTLAEFRRAAAAHLEEVNRLRDAANEQASLVAELEDELRACAKRLAEKVTEAGQLQRMLTEVEDAERVRRSRLAELEGLMLRAEHAAAQRDETGSRERAERERDRAELEAARARLSACAAEADGLRSRLAEAERTLAEAALAIRDDHRLVELESQVKAFRERDQRLGELRADAPDPEEVYERLLDLEAQYQAATMAAARVPELEAKIAELEGKIAAAK
ncbi:MAG: hypothetical protein ABSB49_04860 [Polyangia bacterium]|jgi:hypothetical protein